MFSLHSLLRAATAINREHVVHKANVKLLGYNETCSEDWEQQASKSAVRVMSDGGSVVCVGCGEGAWCGNMASAAPMWGRAAGAGCARAPAAAAALRLLALKLRWRRVVLPPTRRSVCERSMRVTAEALAEVGVAVTRVPFVDDDPENRAHAVILCSCDLGEPVAALQELRRLPDVVRPTVVLMCAEPRFPHRRDKSRDNWNYSTPGWKPTATQSSKAFNDSNTDTNKDKKSNKNSTDFEPHPKVLEKREILTEEFEDPVENFLALISEFDEELWSHILFFMENSPAKFKAEAREIYAEALDKIEWVQRAEAIGEERMMVEMILVEKNGDTLGDWNRVASLVVEATRLLKGAWSTEVRGDLSAAWARWRRASSVEDAHLSAALLAGAALAVICFLAFIYSTTRDSRERRAVLLSSEDFAFPEERRVGEGMETMLSCWLQQLHEFGGPPDLLPPPVNAGPPSAPSSWCSVNRLPPDQRTRYKGDPVHITPLVEPGPMELKRKAKDILLVMQNIRHENINPFIGCVCSPRGALVWEWCARGTLEDVLKADAIRLDWAFRLSLLTDAVRGIRYVHTSALRVHGALSSRACLVDARWLLRIADVGMPAFCHAQGLPPPQRSARDLLWTAPELLREYQATGELRGTQAGDVFSFGIIMQEVIVRGEPYCMLPLSPDEIIDKLCRPPPLIRPSVSLGAAPPEAVSLMRQCWAESPDQRPDFNALHALFTQLNRGRKVNIVDSMFEMLEKYSNNLEELIKERTEQLDMEKRKTEQLLNRMLPKSVAESLVLGLRVEPEEFADVSVYFSDIVGFTALAARSTPVQVVDLLNQLYTTFDAAIQQYSVYKVETIGDAYMVVSGAPVRYSKHAEALADMALHLLHLAGALRVRGAPVLLRAGMHSGACCAGVVGLTMPRYCLFGDTVNTASRMESTGAAWRIQLSSATAARLRAAGGYTLAPRGPVLVKGKGSMHTYWLLGKDGFDKPLPTPPPIQCEDPLMEMEAENESEGSSSTRACTPATPVEPSEQEEEKEQQNLNSVHSGAKSADSSPSHRPPAPSNHTASYARYRWLGGRGARTVRRQWSLERGEALAESAAMSGAGIGACSGEENGAGNGADDVPLALFSAPVPPPTHPRYRTRALSYDPL